MDARVRLSGSLPCSLERLEDAVEDLLQHQGEIIGAGIDAHGAMIEVRFRGRSFPKKQAVALLREALGEFARQDQGVIAIEGEEFPLT